METEAVFVVGAGQAGLAAGYYLRASGTAFAIVEACDHVGDGWRRRYDGLTLFTPRRFSRLPGLAMPGDPAGYPTKDEFAGYLEAYVQKFRLPVRTGKHLVRLAKEGKLFSASFEDGTVRRAERVIVATGGFQKPVVPHLASGFDSRVLQLTAEDYRNPRDLPFSTILVVGDGASGRDIATECVRRGRVLLAVGKPRKLLPERLLGQSIWWWLDASGLLRAGPRSISGRMLRKADAFPDRGNSLDALAAAGVEIMPRLVGADGNVATFEDGRSSDISAIVWCVGYRDETGWMQIEGATDRDGALLHEKGVSPVPGLYFVGKPWQRNRSSALVMGAGPDARAVTESIRRAAEHPAIRSRSYGAPRWSRQ